MTYVGAPHIYYGDEIAMEGGKDPDCRRPFLWTWDKDPKRAALHDYYKKLIGLRKAHAALRTGEFRSAVTDGKLYGYVRSAGGEDFLVLLNTGTGEATATVDLAPWGGQVKATDLLNGASLSWNGGSAKVAVPGESGMLFRLEKTAS
jgi:glycosidase